MIKIKLELEKVLLMVFFAIILFLGPGVLFDHRIKHDFPFAYSASDSFQHQVRAEAIKEMGNFKYEAEYISKGFENAVGRYPPVVYHLAVIFSYASGVETYDAIYFVVVFFAIISIFIMYIIIKDFNKTAALLAIPMSMLIFSFPLSTGFLWGHWPSIVSQAFLVLFFWSIMRIDLDKSFILIALSLSAVTLAHTSEAFFALIFLALFLAIKLIYKKIDKNDILNIIIGFIIFLAISVYFWIIFFNTWAVAQPYSFSIDPVWEGNPGFYIGGFGLLLVPMAFGAILLLLKSGEAHSSAILAFAMLISGFLNYIGFQLRSFQIRFFWPIYLSIFFGFGIYIIIKFIIKKWSFALTSALFIIFVVLFSGFAKLPAIKQTDVQVIPSIPYINRGTSSGIMDSFHWEALAWLSKNAEHDARVYFFYGDIYSQDALLRNSKRVHYQVDPNDFIKALQERKLKRGYVSELPGDSGGSIAVRTGIFSFEDVTRQKPPEYFLGLQDICRFDYFVFDKAARQPVLAQYNMLIANELAKNNFIDKVFENQIILILKNNKPGDECIEERSF